MTVFLQLGKNGDLISMLPLVALEFKTTGIKPSLLVSKQYAGILSRVDYCQPVIYDGEWDDLLGAIKFARQNFENVIVTQTYGRKFPIQFTRSSFQLEAWERAGKLNLWDTLPLELNRCRITEMETLSKLGANGKRFVLFADHSQSSPFLQKDELFELVDKWLLRQPIPRKMVRLSEIKLPSLCDFLPLYDLADAIIAVESAHLHLTKTSKTPVLALTADRPTTWHGSAYSNRFHFYCRYSDFNDRKVEFLDSLNRALTLTGKLEQIVIK